MCDNSFQTSLSSGPAPYHHPLSPILPSLFLSFFYTKIHESLASGVAVGWIKVLWLPLLWVRGPSVQLNISEWRDHSLKVTHSRATQSGIDGRDFQLCAWEMFPAICSCDVFYFSVSRFPPHTSHSRGEENRGKHSPRSSPPFYVRLQDLLTLFNYGAFLKTALAVGKCCHSWISPYLQSTANLHKSIWWAGKKKTHNRLHKTPTLVSQLSAVTFGL